MNVLITKGTKGLGLATALHNCHEGNHVFINYHADGAAAEFAIQVINRRGR